MLPDDASGPGLFLSPVPVPQGDPAALARAAATFASAHGEIDRNRATLTSAASQAGGVGWTGAGAAACFSAAGELANAYALTAAALGQGATALRAYSASLAAAQQLAHRANDAVAATNATARALAVAQVAAQRAQDAAAEADRASAAADAQAAASPHSPAAHLAAANARAAASDASSSAGDAVTRLSALSAQYDSERSRAVTLCAQATEQASHATNQAVTAFDAAAAQLTGPPGRPAGGGAAGVPGQGGHHHSGFWSGLLHGAEHLGEDLVNGAASLGNGIIHDPGGVFALLGGIGLAGISAGGEALGVGLDATGVGAVAGVPINALSAAGIASGTAMAGAGAASIARHAAGSDHVTLMQSGSGDGGESAAEGGNPGHSPGSSEIPGPKEFDPESLKGLSPQQVQDRIPSDWARVPSKSGGGEVFRDPANPGRQIRIMPGYAAGSRPDPLTTGPYAVVSQNGVTVKIPLSGNPMLP
jgi:hypothetical protein